ncbi:unnamed protein product [Ophioblennius macclurei]
MEALVLVLKSHPGPSMLLFSLLFRLISWMLQKLPVPEPVKQDRFRYFKYRNISLSLFHSVLSGTWALTCTSLWPEPLVDLHSFHTPLSYLLVLISSGYFVQDAADIILSGHARGCWESLLHHALVIWCFIYTLYSHLYVEGAVVALFVEVNSVTLHSRMLLKMVGAQGSALFAVLKYANVLTYVTFRLPSQFFLTWYIVHNYGRLHHAGLFLVSMVLSNIMNLVHFYRLLRADFFPSAHRRNGGAKLMSD